MKSLICAAVLTHVLLFFNFPAYSAPPEMVADIVIGSTGSGPGYLTVFKDKLYFTTVTTAYGYELWMYRDQTTGTFPWKLYAPILTSTQQQPDK